MEKLVKDTKNRNLGKKRHTCRICQNTGDFISYLPREMMIGTFEEFEYFVCDVCGCMQIADVPEDMGKYYDSEYYSFLLTVADGYKFNSPIRSTAKILDVGCGNGHWLFQTAKDGATNLYGCDPFISHDIQYDDRVYISKCEIGDIDEKENESFDLIRMSDSFEHMTNPLEALQSAYRLLKPEGGLIINIPVFPNALFDLYGVHWAQLDAPRHIFLHSKKSMLYLAEKTGFVIAKITYNSNMGPIFASYFQQFGIPLNKYTDEMIQQHFSPADILELKKTYQEINAAGYSDHAEFLLAKNPD